MIAAGIALASAGFLALALVGLSSARPGYSHFRDTISEIGETGSPHQRVVAFGVFLPIGLSLLICAWLFRSASAQASVLALCIAAGYIGAALFPCDPGSPTSGSTRQAIHNIAGAVEYIGGGFALVNIARDLGQPFRAAGFLVLASAVGLSVIPARYGRGLLQRIAEACLFGGLALAIWRLAPAT